MFSVAIFTLFIDLIACTVFPFVSLIQISQSLDLGGIPLSSTSFTYSIQVRLNTEREVK